MRKKSLMILEIILLLIFIVILINAFSGKRKDENEPDSPPLTLSISSSKKEYIDIERIDVNVTLRNNSKASITINKDLRQCITIHLKVAGKKVIQPYRLFFPRPTKDEDLLKLEPNNFYGSKLFIHYNSDEGNHLLGKNEIKAVYHHPKSESKKSASKVWHGTLESNKLEIIRKLGPRKKSFEVPK